MVFCRAPVLGVHLGDLAQIQNTAVVAGASRGRANESWWRSPYLQSRMEPVGSTGARDVPGETMIFRGQAVEVDGKHCPRHRWRWDPRGHTYPGVRVRHCVGQVGKAWWGLV